MEVKSAEVLSEAGVSSVAEIFLDMPGAARRANLSIRHFNRLLEDDVMRPRVFEVGNRHKLFCLVKDLDVWIAARRARVLARKAAREARAILP